MKTKTGKMFKAQVASFAVAFAGAAMADTWTDPDTGIEWSYVAEDRGGTTEARIYGGNSAAIPTDTKGAITVPSTLGGYPVTSIGALAFYHCPDITSVTVPDGITSVGEGAFYWCGALESVTLPSSAINFGNWAFRKSAIKRFDIPVGCTIIPEEMFDGCKALESVTIPDSVTNIGVLAFTNCNNLEMPEIPDSVATIGNGAFAGCTKMADENGWVIVRNVLYAYAGETTDVAIPSGVVEISSRAFDDNRELKSVMIPTTVTNIESSAFSRCESLATVTIPASVSSIGSSAFYKTALATVYYSSSDTEERVSGLISASGYDVSGVTFVPMFTVTFDPNGGSIAEADATRIVNDGVAVGELPDAMREGYWEFVGWFTESEGGEQISAETAITADVTYYAHWTSTWDPATIAINTADEYAAADDGSFDLDLAALILSKDPPTVTVKGLPAGIKYTAKTGIVAGTSAKPGRYTVSVGAKSKSVKTPAAKNFDVVVPNLKDTAIPVKDSYDEMIPGVGHVVEIPEAVGCKVSGLPAGMKWTAKAVNDKALGEISANSAYGAPTKPGSYTVYFTKTTKEENDQGKTVSVKHTATSTFTVGPFPVLTVDFAGDGTGKVTGAGAYAAGKKVTLKATADTKDAAATDKKPETRKSVFLGYYDGETLVTNVASYSLAMPSVDKTITAKFITAAEDAAAVTAAVGDVAEFNALNVSEEVRVSAGVYIEWPVAADGLTPVSVKVAGLPAGLKFTAKDIMKKGSKTEVEVRANTIYGAPTAASKKDKGGKPIPSAVKITVTTAGKTVVNYTLETTVEALPDWAVGTFNGGGINGQATLAVAANGKISGKYLSEGKTWTLSAACFDLYDEAEDEYVATLTAKSGKEERSERIVLSEDDVGGEILASGDLGMLIFIQTNWKAEQWKNIGKVIANKEFVLEGTEDRLPKDADKVTLKFAATGAVSVKGVFDMGLDARNRPVTHSATGSATLIPLSEPEAKGEEKPDEKSFDCGVFVYLPPKAGKFDGFVTIVRLEWTGTEFIPSPAD